MYVSSILITAFGFGMAFDSGVSMFWDNWNKGVSIVCLHIMRLLISSAFAETMEGYQAEIPPGCGVEQSRAVSVFIML